jgi:alcohol dehydrogenase
VLTIGMPPQVTADTGMDAFAHAFEAVTSGQANPMSDMLGEKAISLVCKSLPVAFKDGKNLDARTDMSFAASCAGYAFVDSLTHLGHNIGHSLGSSHHIPHGNACVLAMPEIAEFIAEYTPGVRKVGVAMGIKDIDKVSDKEAGQMVRDAIRALNKSVGIKGLKNHNVKESDLPAMSIAVANEGLGAFAPRKATADDWLEIMKRAYTYTA